eukprot:372532-Prymnesium_polylepis.1
MVLLCCCCCCCTHPPWRNLGGTQPPGATSEHTGARRTPSCPRSARPRAHTTSGRACSPLSALGQTSYGFLSASRRGYAQRAAKHGQQAKGSSTTRSARQGKVRQRAPIPTKRRRSGGGTKGHAGVGKGIGMG